MKPSCSMLSFWLNICAEENCNQWLDNTLQRLKRWGGGQSVLLHTIRGWTEVIRDTQPGKIRELWASWVWEPGVIRFGGSRGAGCLHHCRCHPPPGVNVLSLPRSSVACWGQILSKECFIIDMSHVWCAVWRVMKMWTFGLRNVRNGFIFKALFFLRCVDLKVK